MIVGHAEEVVAGILEQGGIARRGAEGIYIRSFPLGAGTCVAEGTFEIAHSKVSILKQRFDIAEQVHTVMGRQFDLGKGGSHHNVARHGDGEGIGKAGTRETCSNKKEKKSFTHYINIYRGNS